MQNFSEQIKQKALELGFDACGITSAQFLKEHEPLLYDWLSREYQGEMEYMTNNLEIRLDSSKIIENGKSVIVVLKSYNHSNDYNTRLKISKYAKGIDYHFVMKEGLSKLLSFIQQNHTNVKGRAFVDSAPLLERALAQKAGLGWIGKNAMLIHKELGSFVFIGELVVDIELAYDKPYRKEHCGSCSLCLNNCPASAIVSPKIIDARRCISYLTIEKRGELDDYDKQVLNNWIFGCDACQDVCPWNKKAKEVSEDWFVKYKDELNISKEEWLEMTSNQFKKKYKSSPLQRAGLKQIIRNILAND